MTEPAVQGPGEAISVDLLTDPAGVPRARAMLQRAQWAASAFARYDRATVDRIVHAAAAAGAAQAREYADWAVRETGFGVAEHKVIKNLASSTGLIEAYAGHDYVTPRVDPAARMVEIPRPAGVVLALTPSTNPVATVFVDAVMDDLHSGIALVERDAALHVSDRKRDMGKSVILSALVCDHVATLGLERWRGTRPPLLGNVHVVRVDGRRLRRVRPHPSRRSATRGRRADAYLGPGVPGRSRAPQS